MQVFYIYLMNLKILSVQRLILGSEGLQGTHMDVLNTFSFKINDIDTKRRFVNLFRDFSPL